MVYWAVALKLVAETEVVRLVKAVEVKEFVITEPFKLVV